MRFSSAVSPSSQGRMNRFKKFSIYFQSVLFIVFSPEAGAQESMSCGGGRGLQSEREK
jgi:hypothetical protein